MTDQIMHPEAAAIARGVMRLLRGFDYVSITEMTLANHRRADVCGIGAKGEVVIVELNRPSPISKVIRSGRNTDHIATAFTLPLVMDFRKT